jgi:beta-lactam-binding protein with PASTA domain
VAGQNPFAITPATTGVKLDQQGRGELTFSVSNTTGRPLRGRAKITAQDTAQQSWFRLDGEAERNFAAEKSTEQYVVRVSAPPNTPPQKAVAHLDMFSVAEPQEVFTNGPMVTFEKPAPIVINGGGHNTWIWIVVAAVVALIVIGGVVFLIMNHKSAVPDVMGMTMTDAETKITAAGMTLGQKTSRKSGKTPGTVIAQTPAGGEAIPEHKTVNVDVEEEPARDVEVPNIVGQNMTNAQDTLTKIGLKAGKFTYDMNAPGQPNTVLNQNPRPGVRILLDQEVEMVVKGDSVQVPALVGAEFQNAAIQLQNRDLMLRITESPQDPRLKRTGTVISQSPNPNTMVARKSLVNLVVATAGSPLLWSPVMLNRIDQKMVIGLPRSLEMQKPPLIK